VASRGARECSSDSEGSAWFWMALGSVLLLPALGLGCSESRTVSGTFPVSEIEQRGNWLRVHAAADARPGELIRLEIFSSFTPYEPLDEVPQLHGRPVRVEPRSGGYAYFGYVTPGGRLRTGVEETYDGTRTRLIRLEPLDSSLAAIIQPKVLSQLPPGDSLSVVTVSMNGDEGATFHIALEGGSVTEVTWFGQTEEGGEPPPRSQFPG